MGKKRKSTLDRLLEQMPEPDSSNNADTKPSADVGDSPAQEMSIGQLLDRIGPSSKYLEPDGDEGGATPPSASSVRVQVKALPGSSTGVSRNDSSDNVHADVMFVEADSGVENSTTSRNSAIDGPNRQAGPGRRTAMRRHSSGESKTEAGQSLSDAGRGSRTRRNSADARTKNLMQSAASANPSSMSPTHVRSISLNEQSTQFEPRGPSRKD